jgi:hypothetical protein
VAGATQVAAVLDRRRARQFAAGVVDPGGVTVRRGHKIITLERGHYAIGYALTSAWDLRQRRFSSLAEAFTIGRRERGAQATDQNFRIGIVGEQHGRASQGLRNDQSCAMLSASSNARAGLERP